MIEEHETRTRSSDRGMIFHCIIDHFVEFSVVFLTKSRLHYPDAFTMTLPTPHQHHAFQLSSISQPMWQYRDPRKLLTRYIIEFSPVRRIATLCVRLIHHDITTLHRIIHCDAVKTYPSKQPLI
jgi:hypothetical protein